MCGGYRLAGGIDVLNDIESTIGAPMVAVSDAARQVLRQGMVHRAYHEVPGLHAGAHGEARISLMY